MPVNKKLHLNTLKKQWKHHRKTHRLVFVAFCVNPPSWSPIIFLLQVTHFAVLLKQEVRGSHMRGLTWGGHVSEILWPSNSGGDISIWNKMTDRQTDRPDISLAAYCSHPLLYLFHLLIHSVQMKWTEVQTLECWWMQRSVVGGEREKSEGESREAQFTHMVLVSGVPLKDNVVWKQTLHFTVWGHF